MITQQHDHKIQQKAQVPSPVKQHRWLVVLFSILGVALPLIAGSMLWWAWGVPNFMDSQGVLSIVLVEAFVSVAAGAFLLYFAFRVWWVAVFAVVAWIVGEFLSVLVRTLVEGRSSQLLTWDPFWSIQVGIIFMAIAALSVGAAFGVGCA